MSIKDLFNKGHSLKFLKDKNERDLKEDLESFRYVDAYAKRRRRYFPEVDFTTASNFAYFGLAELYYEESIKRIYQTYPYDGSLAEKLEWENDSNYLDIFIFDNEYPRTNGFISINSGSSTYTSTTENNIYSSSAPQYVFFKGGPHADPSQNFKDEFSAGPSKDGISKANIYHTASKRANNLELNLTNGVTVEFWLKKEGWADESTSKEEHFFNLSASGSSGDSYGNLRIYSLGTSPNSGSMIMNIESGSTNLSFTHNTGLENIADENWHHYAFTAKSSGSVTLSSLYVDGNVVSQQIDNDQCGEIKGKLIASLGALAGPISSSLTVAAEGWGNVISSSFDEFRYWKIERNSEQIGRNYRSQIGGGTNTDNSKYNKIISPVNLGVYFKFNEGIVGEDAIDSTVLDYSGRISNGTFINYDSTTCRSTGSAIVLAGAATKEFKDPILYANHPQVSSLLAMKKASGSMHDNINNVSLYRSMPAWIQEEDEKKSDNLKFLTQIMASFFDDLFLQIKKLPRLKDVNYPYDNDYEKPLPFADRLLTTRGYDVPELFADASTLSKFLERDEKILFEKKLYEVKNTIYQNIYNNLSYIQKSKGTTKSLRNFLRCFGVDEELIKLNVYANNDVYEFKDNFTNTAVRKRYADFDDAEVRIRGEETYQDAYSANVYQYYDPTNANSISYIPAVSSLVASGSAATIEVEVIFPKRDLKGNTNHTIFGKKECSLFGLHAVKASNTDLTYESDNVDDSINFNVMATRPDNDLRNVKFVLTSSGDSKFSKLESESSFPRVYDNQKWNLAFRIRPTKYPLASLTTGSLNAHAGDPETAAYTYELYGVNYMSNILQDDFILSGTMSTSQAEKFFTNPKRIFIGAKRSNYTGSIERFSDVKISSVRFWMDYLSDQTIQAHAKNAASHGTFYPYQDAWLAPSFASSKKMHVPQADTLLLNWDFSNVTGSDSSGQFLVNDLTSGSAKENRYGWFSDLAKHHFSGRGDNFVSTVGYRDQAIDIDFVQTAKQKLPEVVNSDDMIKVLSKQDDVVFTRDTTYVQHYLSIEKSMYQTISEEMLKFFATAVGFNNLVGDPVNRYRPHYKRMAKLRSLFFEKVENEPDLDKFIEYFKWVDDAVTAMIQQLIPVSSNSTSMLRNMVESHLLERNKYWNKFPTIDSKSEPPLGVLKSIKELKYNWKFGHPNLTLDEETSCLWWAERALRSDNPISSGDGGTDKARNDLLKIIITEVSGAEPNLKTIDGMRYTGSYYPIRKLSKPVDITSGRSLFLKGGGNSQENKKVDFYKGVTTWGSDDDFIYLDFDNESRKKICNDPDIPPELDKEKIRFRALAMRANQTKDSLYSGLGGENDARYEDAKSSLVLPFSAYTSSLNIGPPNTTQAGYQGIFSGSSFGIDFTNLHEDKTGIHAEVPMQGPFTEANVGGNQHRHIAINRHRVHPSGGLPQLDTTSVRPEAWHLQEFLNIPNSSAAVESIISETFANVTSLATNDIRILALPAGSVSGDPSPFEYWRNGVGADNEWTFLQGPHPTPGTGPAGSLVKHAYTEVLPERVGQTFSLVTPLIDLLDVDRDSTIVFGFSYFLHGLQIGTLEVQASRDSLFQEDVETLFTISGQQHASSADSFTFKYLSSGNSTTYTDTSLLNWVGKRFYIRFLYTAGMSQISDACIGAALMWKEPAAGRSTGLVQNSFKLMDPTYDDHHRPRAVYTRQEYAKRPVNIRNISMEQSGTAPTIAGNYLNRYEYLNSVSRETNDPWFRVNRDTILESPLRLDMLGETDRTNADRPGLHVGALSSSFVQTRLSLATQRREAAISGRGDDLSLPDRTFITGTTRNRTIFANRFSSPGGFETLSRGFLDPEHETFSVYNALTWRNYAVRKNYDSTQQAHMGKFGISQHYAPTSVSNEHEGTARVYPGHFMSGSDGIHLPTSGSISAENYQVISASAHRQHRNNIERIEHSDPDGDFRQGNVATVSKFDNRFVSHAIPRTDQQYRWVTGSLSGSS